MASINQIRQDLTIQNPKNESPEFMSQNATTQVTKDAQAANSPLDQLAQIMKIPMPAPTNPFYVPTAQGTAVTQQSGSTQAVDSVRKNRNPFVVPSDETQTYGLQIPQ
jgi:hypothetical protein